MVAPLFLLLSFLLLALADRDNRFVVELKDSANVVSKLNELNIHSESVVYTFDSPIFKGYTLQDLTEDEKRAIGEDEDVESIEEDEWITLPSVDWDPRPQTLLGDDPVFPDEIQSEPLNWGLDRIDQRTGLNNQYEYQYTGNGVDIYIMDSGINSEHIDFQGRLSSECFTSFEEEGCLDLHGHGSHVAGIAAGLYSGVAKQANIINVKVLNFANSGFKSGIIAGLEWIVERYGRVGSPPSVINISIGAARNLGIYNRIFARMIRVGLFVATSAMNAAESACSWFPASVDAAVTVGATDYDGSTDFRSGFSNFGRCVDIFAPGSRILSSSHTNNTEVIALSGTSMASPLVAGVAALYLEANPTWSITEVRNAILRDATPDVIADTRRGSPNLLLYSGAVKVENLRLCGCPVWRLVCVVRCFVFK